MLPSQRAYIGDLGQTSDLMIVVTTPQTSGEVSSLMMIGGTAGSAADRRTTPGRPRLPAGCSRSLQRNAADDSDEDEAMLCRQCAIDQQHVAVVDADAAHLVTGRAPHERRVGMPDEDVIEVEPWDRRVGTRRAERTRAAAYFWRSVVPVASNGLAVSDVVCLFMRPVYSYAAVDMRPPESLISRACG